MLTERVINILVSYLRKTDLNMKKKISADYKKKLPKGYNSELKDGLYWIFDYVHRNTLIWGETRHFAVKNFLIYKGVKDE